MRDYCYPHQLGAHREGYLREKRGRSIYSGRRGEDRRGRTKMAAVGERIRGKGRKNDTDRKGERKVGPCCPSL